MRRGAVAGGGVGPGACSTGSGRGELAVGDRTVTGADATIGVLTGSVAGVLVSPDAADGRVERRADSGGGGDGVTDIRQP